MKNILVPISFTETTQDALDQALSIAEHYGAALTLIHCYSALEYNRIFDFDNDDYKNGVKRELQSFYNKYKQTPTKFPIKYIALEESLLNMVHKESKKYELMILIREPKGVRLKNRLLSEKISTLISKSSCPVLVGTVNGPVLKINELQSIWHIKRNQQESPLISRLFHKWGLSSSILKVKSLDQKVFTSPFWKKLLMQRKRSSLESIKELYPLFEQEKIDLVIFAHYSSRLSDSFMNDSVILSISDLSVPFLVFNLSNDVSK